jgi:uncharacterized OB-fold protein
VTPLSVFVCEACGAVFFPARAVCTRCGESRWREEVAAGGVVEETTEHREVAIASVRTDLGPVVIARSSAPRAARVRLELDGGAPVAER